MKKENKRTARTYITLLPAYPLKEIDTTKPILNIYSLSEEERNKWLREIWKPK